MQPDGNFVLYTASSSVVWATDSANSPRAYLEMQDDGQVVVWFNGIKKFSSGVTAECVKPAYMSVKSGGIITDNYRKKYIKLVGEKFIQKNVN